MKRGSQDKDHGNTLKHTKPRPGFQHERNRQIPKKHSKVIKKGSQSKDHVNTVKPTKQKSGFQHEGNGCHVVNKSANNDTQSNSKPIGRNNVSSDNNTLTENSISAITTQLTGNTPQYDNNVLSSKSTLSDNSKPVDDKEPHITSPSNNNISADNNTQCARITTPSDNSVLPCSNNVKSADQDVHST